MYKKSTGRGASSRRFVQKIGEMTFLFVGGATQVSPLIFCPITSNSLPDSRRKASFIPVICLLKKTIESTHTFLEIIIT